MKASKVLFLVVALVGFVDATYLTVQHFLGAIPPCFVVDGCSTILNSAWSSVAGVPVALFGAMYYLFVFCTMLYGVVMKSEKITRISAGATVAGLLASIWFMILQVFILKSYCSYCIISAMSSTILFVLGAILLFSKRQTNNVIEKVG